MSASTTRRPYRLDEECVEVAAKSVIAERRRLTMIPPHARGWRDQLVRAESAWGVLVEAAGNAQRAESALVKLNQADADRVAAEQGAQ